jgi:hypothetical protein
METKSAGYINGYSRWAMRKGMSVLLADRCWVILLGLVAFLAAGCGGGGGSSLSSSGGTVQVSMASAPGFPAGTSFTASPAAVEEAAKPAYPSFDNVFVKVWKVALLPSKEGDGPDPGGEALFLDDDSDRSGTFVAVELDSPRVINLLDLPPGRKLAMFLNKFLDVPAGTYGKIRVYYRELWGYKEGESERIDFHPTANSHFDVHFVGGDLVIPVAPDPERGIHLFEVTINFVGLKIVENKNKVLMRPQVFATVGAVQYVISGIADNVDTTLGTFDVSTDGGPSFHTMFSFDNNITKWAFKDSETMQQVAVDNNLGIAALRDGTLVDVFGMFTGIDTLFADDVVITFTEWIEDRVAPGDEPPSGWKTVDTTEFFEFSFSGDNVVIPMPSRTEARYDNNADLSQIFPDNVIVDNTLVRARGYFVPGEGVDAFWISWVSGP